MTNDTTSDKNDHFIKIVISLNLKDKSIINVYVFNKFKIIEQNRTELKTNLQLYNYNWRFYQHSLYNKQNNPKKKNIFLTMPLPILTKLAFIKHDTL